MLTDTDIQALVEAATHRLQVSFTYLKATSGETVQHTGGIVEITSDGRMWLWDTTLNDHIRQFFMSNMNSPTVLQQPFDNMAAGGFPLKINGQIIIGA